MKEEGNRLSALEKRNLCYKGFENLAIYDPNIPIQRAQIQKSTAFDASEKAEDIVASSGIKNIRDKMSDKPKSALCEGNLFVVDAGGVDGKKMWVCLIATNKDRGRSLVGFDSDARAKEYISYTDESGPMNIVPEFEVILQVYKFMCSHLLVQ